MGSVAVLHPQHLFNHNHYRHQLISPAMKSPSARRNLHPAPRKSSNRRKRSPQKGTTLRSKENNHHHNSSPPSKPTSKGPVMAGPFKILKRGEALPVFTTPSSLDLTLKEEHQQPPPPVQKAPVNTTTKIKKMGAGATRELAVLSHSEPELKQIRQISDCYAGSAFISSPPPSSLPLPAFFRKKNLVLTDDDNSNSDDATSDLLRLLKLDLS